MLKTSRALLILAFVAPMISSMATLESRSSRKPNIVFILVDDQDLHLDSLAHMDILQKQLVRKGVFFTKHYGHVSQCCPARTTIWTGKHAHNTNVTSVWPNTPGGAWKAVQEFGWYNRLLFGWMQSAGYMTYYSGKIFNGYDEQNYCQPNCINGLSKADIFLDPSTYAYYNTTYAHYDENGWKVKPHVDGYSTDQVANNVNSFVEYAVNMDEPFFAVAAPVAPHLPSRPKHEYKDLYKNLTMPKSPNFNPVNRTGVGPVWTLDRLNDTNVASLDHFYRKRQRCLKSVDDLVGSIINKLEELGVLENTFIFYSSDNGFHIGNHRLQGGKDQCFEEDINIPFIVRGPGVSQGQTSDLITGHVDIAPTMLEIAGIDGTHKYGLDGTALTFPFESEVDLARNLAARGENTHVEMWGPFKQEWKYHLIGEDFDVNLNIYKALRVQGWGYNLMYSVWCQNSAHELYDMSWDPYQMTNLHPEAPSEMNTTNAYHMGMDTLLGRPVWRVIHRLDALVLVQKTCAGDSCRQPWNQLHPDGNVQDLAAALHTKYDRFYENSYNVAKVGWQQCYKGLSMHSSSTLYSLDNEQPLWLNETVVRLVRSAGHKTRAQDLMAALVVAGFAHVLSWFFLCS